MRFAAKIQNFYNHQLQSEDKNIVLQMQSVYLRINKSKIYKNNDYLCGDKNRYGKI